MMTVTYQANGQGETAARRPRRRVTQALLALVVVTFLSVGFLTAEAGAFTIPKKSGSPGSLLFSKVEGMSGANYGGTYAQVTWLGGIVGRSPSYPSSKQWVCVRPRFYLYTSSVWKIQAVGSWDCDWIQAGATSRAVASQWMTSGFGYWSVDVEVQWILPNNTVVGTATLDYNLASEYQCRLGNVLGRCDTGNNGTTGWVHIS